MKPVVQTKRLGKTFHTPAGPVPVLSNVTMTLEAGSFCAITGPSGSGKTTLLNLISLLDTPSHGEIHIDGQPLHAANEGERIRMRKHTIGMVFQKFCLLPRRNVLENILFRARYTDTPRDQWIDRAHRLMATFGLDTMATREARLLSGGEMQRVAIARALLVPPALLVADEPTGNLDRNSAMVVMEALSAVHQQGIAVLLVTHNTTLLPFAQRHYECREGRLWPAS